MPGPDVRAIPLYRDPIAPGVDKLPAGIEVRRGQMPGWHEPKEVFVFQNVRKGSARYKQAIVLPAPLEGSDGLVERLEDLAQ